MLKKQKGNMYEFVTHMWAPVRGKCKHDCSYCYMKKWPLPPLHIDARDIETNLGEGNFIFVCHTIDLFADDVPAEWIEWVLGRLRAFPKNRYLLQSKNPQRFLKFISWYPDKVIFGTTIETNRDIVDSKAPSVLQRANALHRLSGLGYSTMVTLEPIFDFDVNELVEIVISAKPEWVNIGADSKSHNLQEPSKDKVKELIELLQKTTQIKLKRNLERIYGKSP